MNTYNVNLYSGIIRNASAEEIYNFLYDARCTEEDMEIICDFFRAYGSWWYDGDDDFDNPCHIGYELDNIRLVVGYTGVAGKYWNDGEDRYLPFHPTLSGKIQDFTYTPYEQEETEIEFDLEKELEELDKELFI